MYVCSFQWVVRLFCYLYSVVVWFRSASTCQVIGWEDRLWNGLYSVVRDVNLSTYVSRVTSTTRLMLYLARWHVEVCLRYISGGEELVNFWGNSSKYK